MAALNTARPKLVTASGGGTYGNPARAELGVCIAERDACARVLTALRAAETKLADQKSAAYAAMETAKRDLERAKADAPSVAISIAMGEEVKTSLSVAEARAAVTRAQDNYDAASAAVAGFNGRFSEADYDLKKAEERVVAAAKAVVGTSPAMQSMLSEVLKAQRDLISKGRVLSWAIDHRILPGRPQLGSGYPQPGSEHYVAFVTKTFVDNLDGNLLPDSHSANGNIDALRRLYSGVPEWQAVVEALTKDANAPVPGAP